MTTIASNKNKISNTVKSLCQRLNDNDPTLTTINLRCVYLGNEGSHMLGNAIGKTKHLKVLVLYRNSIDSVKAMTYLCNGLSINTSIQTLFFYGNVVCNECAHVFSESVLKINTTIQRLFLEGKHCNERGKSYLINGLSSNTTLEYCYIDQSLQDVTDYYSKVNKSGGRKLMKECGSHPDAADPNTKVPTSLWTNILYNDNNDPDLLYYYLQSKPELFTY